MTCERYLTMCVPMRTVIVREAIGYSGASLQVYRITVLTPIGRMLGYISALGLRFRSNVIF